jgi:hypothetical protein
MRGQALEQLCVLPRTALTLQQPGFDLFALRRGGNPFLHVAYCYKFKMEQTSPRARLELRSRDWTAQSDRRMDRKGHQNWPVPQETAIPAYRLRYRRSSALIALDLAQRKRACRQRGCAGRTQRTVFSAPGIVSGVMLARPDSGQEIEAAAALPRTVESPLISGSRTGTGKAYQYRRKVRSHHHGSQLRYQKKRRCISPKPALAWKYQTRDARSAALLSCDAPSMAKVPVCVRTLHGDAVGRCRTRRVAYHGKRRGGTVCICVKGSKRPRTYAHAERGCVRPFKARRKPDRDFRLPSTGTNRMLARTYQKLLRWTIRSPRSIL